MSIIKSTQDGRFECLLWLRPLSKSVPRRFYLFHLRVVEARAIGAQQLLVEIRIKKAGPFLALPSPLLILYVVQLLDGYSHYPFRHSESYNQGFPI